MTLVVVQREAEGGTEEVKVKPAMAGNNALAWLGLVMERTLWFRCNHEDGLALSIRQRSRGHWSV